MFIELPFVSGELICWAPGCFVLYCWVRNYTDTVYVNQAGIYGCPLHCWYQKDCLGGWRMSVCSIISAAIINLPGS